jgi:hypothetical protein
MNTEATAALILVCLFLGILIGSVVTARADVDARWAVEKCGPHQGLAYLDHFTATCGNGAMFSLPSPNR